VRLVAVRAGAGRGCVHALALDPNSAWAHALNGSLLATYVRDYPAGEREYLKAIALDSTTALGGAYGWLLHGRGLDDSALEVVAAYRTKPLGKIRTVDRLTIRSQAQNHGALDSGGNRHRSRGVIDQEIGLRPEGMTCTGRRPPAEKRAIPVDRTRLRQQHGDRTSFARDAGRMLGKKGPWAVDGPLGRRVAGGRAGNEGARYVEQGLLGPNGLRPRRLGDQQRGGGEECGASERARGDGADRVRHSSTLREMDWLLEMGKHGSLRETVDRCIAASAAAVIQVYGGQSWPDRGIIKTEQAQH
jgi:hypothetical protein